MSIESMLTVAGTDLLSSGLLAKECHLGIGSLQKGRCKNNVLANMPIAIGEWADGLKQNLITDHRIDINTEPDPCDCPPDSGCSCAKVSLSLDYCTWTAPGMAEICLESENHKIKDLMPKFCELYQVPQASMKIWDANGNINMTAEYAPQFYDFVRSLLTKAIIELLAYGAINGDGTSPYQAFGLYSQLANGWEADAEKPCDDTLNTEQIIDWSALTGDDCSPEAETIAEQTVSLWGENYPIPDGLNLVEFLMDQYIPAVSETWADVALWEMHVHCGEERCLYRTLLCLETCGCNKCENGFDNPTLEQYYQRFDGALRVELPNGTPLVIMGTPDIPSGTMRLVPRLVRDENGDLVETYRLWLRDLRNVYGRVSDDVYGHDFGFEANDAIVALSTDERMDLAINVDSTAVLFDVTKEKRCISALMELEYGVLVTCRHLALRIDNVCCQSMVRDSGTKVYVDGELLGSAN